MNGKKILVAAICFVALIATVFSVLSFGAADGMSEGLTIPKYVDTFVTDEGAKVDLDYPEYIYETVKLYEDVPLTMEASVFIPDVKDIEKSYQGIILGNDGSLTDTVYGDSFINYEIAAGLHPQITYADEHGQNSYVVTFDSVTLPKGKWAHVAFVHNGASGVISCYLDGVLKEEKRFYPEFDEGVTDIHFVLGADQGIAHAGNYFKGAIKDVAVFSDVRTADEIASDATCQSYAELQNKDNVICYYDISSADVGKNIVDESLNGYDLFYNQFWLTEDEMNEIRAEWAEKGFDPDYSFAIIGDTQKMNENYPNQLIKMYEWIAANKDNKNIVFSVGLGDITDDDLKNHFSKNDGKWVKDNNGEFNEWDVFVEAISKFNGVIPYALVRGNHEKVETYNAAVKKVAGFVEKFDGINASTYTMDTGKVDPRSKEAVSYANTWQKLTVNVDGTEVKYLFLGLDWGATDVVLDWASGVINKNPDHKAVVFTHCYLAADGTTNDEGDGTPPSRWSMDDKFYNDGDDIWEKFVSKHPTVEMVLSGHICSNDAHTTRVNAYDDKGNYLNTVTQILVNPQGTDYRFRSGQVAMFYFDEDKNMMAVEYYAPTRGMYSMTSAQRLIDFDDMGEDLPKEDWDGTTLLKPEGSGTKDDPYRVSTPSNLLWMAKRIFEDGGVKFAGEYFKQTCHLDLDGKSIYSIGYKYFSYENMAAFGGNYDGQGFSIKNGTISTMIGNHASASYFGHGLFGAIFGAVIENVVLDNVVIIGRGVTGGIVGIAAAPEVEDSFTNFNIISGCEIKNTARMVAVPLSCVTTIDFDSTAKFGRLGTICGMAHSTLIEGCSSALDLTFTSEYTMVGGIAGSAGLNTVIENCAYTGTITPYGTRTSSDNIGSVVGVLSPSAVTVCASGNLTSARGGLTVSSVYSTASYPFVAYKTESSGFTYTESDCSTAVSSAIDSAIAEIRLGGSERSVFIGSKAPAITAVDGMIYYDYIARNYYVASSGAFTKTKTLPVSFDPASTKYGAIDNELYIAHPMLLYVKSGDAWSFYAGYDSYFSALEGARARCGGNPDAEVVLYFRADVVEDSVSTNFGWNVGTINIDLGGHTLYQSGKYGLFPAVAKYSNSANSNNISIYGADGKHVIENGNIVLNNMPIFDIYAYAAKYDAIANATVYKKFKYTFKDVDISLAEGSTLTNIFGTYSDSSTVGTDGTVENMLLDVTFDDNCSIDITNATKNVTLFDANDTVYSGTVSGATYGATNSITNIHVGAIDVYADSAFTWYTVNENNDSSVDFKAGLTLTAPASFTPPTLVNFTTADDVKLAFGNATDSGSNKVYTLEVDNSTSIITPYGAIPASYKNDYKIVLFERVEEDSYRIVGGFNSLARALIKTEGSDNVESITKNNKDAVAVVYFLDDFTVNEAISGNLCYSIGKVIFDLDGNTLTHDNSEPLFKAYAKYGLKADSYPETFYLDAFFEIKNGEIVLKNHGLFRMGMEGSNAYNVDISKAPTYKTLHWNFDNIDISLASGAELTSLLGTYNESSHATTGNHKMGMDIKFNDNCTIDISNAPEGFTLFNANDTRTTGTFVNKGSTCYETNSIVNVTVGGIEIITGANNFYKNEENNYENKFNWFDVNEANGSSVTFVVGENGYFAKLTVPSGTTPELDVNLCGKDKTFKHDLYNLSGNTYTLVETPYGKITSTYSNANDYPYVVYIKASDESYTFKSGYATFSKACEGARKSMSSTEDISVVYIRKNVSTNTISSNENYHGSTMVIDLGGNTITPVKYFMYAYAKYASDAIATTTGNNPGFYEIKNGEIVLKEYGLLQIGAFNERYAIFSGDAEGEYKVLNFKFDSVKITLAEGATLNSITGGYDENQNVGQYDPNGGENYINVKMGVNITYDNCVFDLSNATRAINPFNANDSMYTGTNDSGVAYTNSIVNISVGDVRVITGNANLHADFFSVAGNGSSVTFGKGKNGKYLTLELPNGKAAPTYDKLNGGAVRFVKVSEGTETTVYTLVPTSLSSFTPKHSLVLESSLVMKVYIPTANLESFTLDGVEYADLSALSENIVTIDGVTYYQLTVNLVAKTAARGVALRAVLNDNGNKAAVNYTFNVVDYAKTVIASGSTELVNLAKDILAYVKASYAYFNGEGLDAKIAEIDSIIGKDYSNPADMTSAADAATPSGTGFTGVTFYLGDTPAYRFYYEGTAPEYTFVVNGRTVEAVAKTEGEGENIKKYLEVKVYAYELLSGITLDGETDHTYSIYSYYNWLTTLANGDDASKAESATTTMSFVEILVKYSESANAYRESVKPAN